ncbi:MAG: hypothetical protein ABI781_07560 [Burkholderiales bacterium]
MSVAAPWRAGARDAPTAFAREAVAMPPASAREVSHSERSVAPQPSSAVSKLIASDDLPLSRSAAIAPRSSPTRPRADAVDMNVAASPQALFTPQAASPVARPLSQRTIDARVTVAAPMPPVIHVTIDRIDVRAPTASPRKAEPPKPQRAAPSVPLADYLRGRVKP